ncbi:hypothetical protein CQW23_31748 [Capsicum baccatum]|uniref:Uncharacterized protein n=1 Tax=Capsicum baccatum TaxID=33114 RepID=A0A2G2V6X0_CAPBA|nr:hypothetical protein CQW23_31748 [Capsicum baccatum]
MILVVGRISGPRNLSLKVFEKKLCFPLHLLVKLNQVRLFLLFGQTQLYIADWIGLKTLDDAGKVKYVKVAGNHLQISSGDVRKHVVPYLAGKASTDGSSVNVENIALHDLQDDASSSFTLTVPHLISGLHLPRSSSRNYFA